MYRAQQKYQKVHLTVGRSYDILFAKHVPGRRPS